MAEMKALSFFHIEYCMEVHGSIRLLSVREIVTKYMLLKCCLLIFMVVYIGYG